MAQSVEQLIRNQQVAGSSPASSSIDSSLVFLAREVFFSIGQIRAINVGIFSTSTAIIGSSLEGAIWNG